MGGPAPNDQVIPSYRATFLIHVTMSLASLSVPRYRSILVSVP
jgi:hypothetical protein